MRLLPGSSRTWLNRSALGPFLNADALNEMEAKFRALDCVGAFSAISLVDSLPMAPADAAVYITSAAATPASRIVRRHGETWDVLVPQEGMVAFLADGTAKQFLSGAWVNASFGSGSAASSVIYKNKSDSWSTLGQFDVRANFFPNGFIDLEFDIDLTTNSYESVAAGWQLRFGSIVLYSISAQIVYGIPVRQKCSIRIVVPDLPVDDFTNIYVSGTIVDEREDPSTYERRTSVSIVPHTSVSIPWSYQTDLTTFYLESTGTPDVSGAFCHSITAELIP